MLKGFIALVLVVAGWVAALWFWVAPDFAHWSLPQLAAMHVLPPLGVGAFWMGGRRWLGVRAERRTEAAEAGAEAERQAEADAARLQAAAETARRRLGCDCRAVAMAQVVAGEDEAPLAEACDGVYFSAFDPSDARGAEGVSIVAHLRSGIQEALGAIYERSPSAASLPVYVVPPSRARADEFVGAVRAVQSALRYEWEALPGGMHEPGRVSQLAGGRSVPEGLVELFERTPGLAIVLLGTDSPWLHRRLTDDDEAATDAGKPGQGVFALLLTHPELAKADSDIQQEKKREALLSVPVLARLHRPAYVEAGGRRMRATELARAIGGSMVQALRNAGLGEPKAAGNGSGNESAEKHEGKPECSWLVHNSGTPASCGTRMAGVGMALSDHGIELDPFDEATNVSTTAGDLGDARSVGMLALAVAKAAATQGNALCVEFCGEDALSLFFARVPESGEAAIGMA